MENRPKIQRHTSKRCSMCGSYLDIVRVVEMKDGVAFESEVFECPDCDFQSKLKKNHKDKGPSKYDF